VFYGFALFEEFLGTNPSARAVLPAYFLLANDILILRSALKQRATTELEILSCGSPYGMGHIKRCIPSVCPPGCPSIPCLRLSRNKKAI